MCSTVLHSFVDKQAGNTGFNKGKEGDRVSELMWRTDFRAVQLFAYFHMDSFLGY